MKHPGYKLSLQVASQQKNVDITGFFFTRKLRKNVLQVKEPVIVPTLCPRGYCGVFNYLRVSVFTVQAAGMEIMG